MRLKTSHGRWSLEFRDWVKAHYVRGWTASQIAIKAHDELGAVITRNAVIGLAHRIGAGEDRVMQSVISLPGPVWSMPDLENVRRAA